VRHTSAYGLANRCANGSTDERPNDKQLRAWLAQMLEEHYGLRQVMRLPQTHALIHHAPYTHTLIHSYTHTVIHSYTILTILTIHYTPAIPPDSCSVQWTNNSEGYTCQCPNDYREVYAYNATHDQLCAPYVIDPTTAPTLAPTTTACSHHKCWNWNASAGAASEKVSGLQVLIQGEWAPSVASVYSAVNTR
jgi:hypothetical protein